MLFALSDEQEQLLASWLGSQHVTADLARRGRVILLLAGGHSVSETARRVGLSRTATYKWIKRFQHKGIAGLDRLNKAQPMPASSPKPVRRRGNCFDLTLSVDEREALLSWQRSPEVAVGLAKRGRLILSLAEGKTVSQAARTVGLSRGKVHKWASRFKASGVNGLLRSRQPRVRKAEDKQIRSAVFSVLHSPPSAYGINRTSWKLRDLRKCLADKSVDVSFEVMREIIKTAGYRWRRARVVLTSTDPEYREKLRLIQSILATLGERDRFFSIDEFGPFAVKMQPGRRLVGPGEYPSVPQYQKSKGFILLTAALELSRNQITHFYSKKKNTVEMIKLLELLLKNHRGCRRLYLSWDAASWHVSKELYRVVEELNRPSYRRAYKTAIVKLAPLPKSAQFLNVIESVFSGMSKAIIHNSNYRSVEEARAAIDRYIHERNENFQRNPKRAGRKIWGMERVPARFSEANNCKDPRW